MADPQDASFRARFLDDYVAECEDHLAALRRTLVTLDGYVGAPLPAATIDDLLRRFHSLKGISGMVEFREAEALAHESESYLRALQKRQTLLTADGVQALIDGSGAFDRLIASLRRGDPAMNVSDLLDRFAALSGAAPSSPTSGENAAPPTWQISFAPRPDLQQRGVTVNSVRQRLEAAGEILEVTPQVSASGGVRFDFIVRGHIPAATLDAWAGDGLTHAPAAAAAAPPSATAAPPTRGDAATHPSAQAHYVRVDLARLDDLMRLIAEVVITRARLQSALARVEPVVPATEWRLIQEQGIAIERHVRDLRDGVMRIRLVPVGEIFERMPLVVRDLARDAQKQVRVEIEGQTTEIDKYLTERLMDPLLHLVRNAISHGIETPAERAARGKPPEAVIRLRAANVGDTVVIQVSDDGRGIDRLRVASRAREAGLDSAADVTDNRVLLDVICAPGFSTRVEADRGSGRGVGMAVVKRSVQELGGTLAVDSTAGEGTTFVMTLPLTLAITDALLASVGSQLFAIPQAAVQELIEVDGATVRQLENNEIMPYRAGILPLVRLASLFGIKGPARQSQHAFVVGTGLESVGLVVDRIVGQREVVVRALTDPFVRVDGISGATELGDGQAVLILDVPALLAQARDGGNLARIMTPRPTPARIM
jgi:two-component system, chemotaxis family, sensor kinase CheA